MIKSSKAIVTLKDIAKACGVTPIVVSTVLRNRDCSVKCSQETRKKITNTAKRMGYRPNKLAQALVKQKSGIIGVIFPVTNSCLNYYAESFSGIRDFFCDKGFTIFSYNTDGSFKDFEQGLEHFFAVNAEGLIFFTGRRGGGMDASVRALVKRGMPIISCLSQYKAKGLTCVLPDLANAAKMALTEFHKLGHESIALMIEPTEGGYATLIFNEYMKFLSENNIPFDKDLILKSTMDIDHSYSVFTHFIRSGKHATAVFVDSDYKAFAAMRAAKDIGLRIPEDISFIGADNLEHIVGLADPPLSTIDFNHYEAGKKSAEILFDKIAGIRTDIPANIFIGPKLVRRKSCSRFSGVLH